MYSWDRNPWKRYSVDRDTSFRRLTGRPSGTTNPTQVLNKAVQSVVFSALVLRLYILAQITVNTTSI